MDVPVHGRSSSHLLVAVTDHSGITSLPGRREEVGQGEGKSFPPSTSKMSMARSQRSRSPLKGDHKPSMKDIKGPRFGLLPLVWVGIILAIFQQFVGINAVFYYPTSSGRRRIR